MSEEKLKGVRVYPGLENIDKPHVNDIPVKDSEHFKPATDNDYVDWLDHCEDTIVNISLRLCGYAPIQINKNENLIKHLWAQDSDCHPRHIMRLLCLKAGSGELQKRENPINKDNACWYVNWRLAVNILLPKLQTLNIKLPDKVKEIIENPINTIGRHGLTGNKEDVDKENSLPKLEDYWNSDFPNTLRLFNDIIIKSDQSNSTQQIIVRFKIYQDHATNTKFIGFYTASTHGYFG